MGTHEVTIKPFNSSSSMMSSSGSESNIYELSAGNTEIRIENEHLYVNGTPYGTLKPGEPILVDHGKVFVDGTSREPVTPPLLEPIDPKNDINKSIAPSEHPPSSLLKE